MIKNDDFNLYYEVFEWLPVGVFIINEKKEIIEWNNWLYEKTNISLNQAQGKKIDNLFSDIKTERFEFALEQVLTYKHPQIMSQVLNGYLIPVELDNEKNRTPFSHMQQSVFLYPIVSNNKMYAMVVIQDVTISCHQRDTILTLAKRFEEDSIRDELTGVYNRRYFWDYLNAELKRSHYESFYINCAIYDIDYFKKINDEYGHDVGDAVLKGFSEAAKETMRSDDKFFRIGGDEFVSISISNKKPTGKNLPYRIHQKIVEKQNYGDFVGKITCSVGVYCVRSCDNELSSKELLEKADDMLYEAKKNGRNQVCSTHH